MHAANRHAVQWDITRDAEMPDSVYHVRFDDDEAATWHPLTIVSSVMASIGTTTVWVTRVSLLVAGPQASPTGAVVLAPGKHNEVIRATDGADQVIVESGTYLVVYR